MKTTLRRLAALLLSAALLTAVFSCDNGGEPKETDPASTETQEPETQPEPKNQYTETNLVVMSDIHLCHLDWYGMKNADRIQKMTDDLNDFYLDEGYDAILFLGDYSLDFWETGIFGSWRHQELSNTEVFFRDYASQLSCETQYRIPGNHEQYGEELWAELSGSDLGRQFYLKIGGYLIFMLDNFDGDLDPDTDNHGVYTPTDVDFIRGVMDENPDMPVILMAHFFDVKADGEEFRDLVCDERVVTLFCGHDHVTTVQELGPDYDNKVIFHCGDYSYSKAAIPENPWGWRTLTLREDGIRVTYYAPESKMVDGKTYNIEAGYLQDYTIPNPLTTETKKTEETETKKAEETEAKPVETSDAGELKNLCAGASIVAGSAGNKDKNGSDKLIDGDRANTKWCVTEDKSLPDELKDKALYYVVIDLGAAHDLKKYAIYGASQSSYGGDSGTTAMDMKSWYLEVSDDNATWTEIDRVTGNTAPVYEGTLDASGRYVRLCILPGGANNGTDDILRLYEMEIFG